MSNFAYDATRGNWQLDGYGLADTLANVASVTDSNGQRYLLVGGGSAYMTADAAVAAAANGDIILLTPGSDAGSVGTAGKSITVEDVSGSGTTSSVPPLVTITSPATTTSHASANGWAPDPNDITGKVLAYGPVSVAGRTVTLTDNGNLLATTTVAADGSFSVDVTFAYEGANSIVASVTDSSGNTGTSAPVVDLLDDIPPTITFTSLAVVSADATQTITGRVVSGGTASVAGADVLLDDNGSILGSAQVQADGSFSVTVTLQYAGANSITASVIDSYGNYARSAPLVDTLDGSAPTVTLSSPQNANVNNASQYISGFDTVLGQTVTLTDNGTVIGTAVSGTYGFFNATVTLFEGTNSIVASVDDDAGNTVASEPVVYTLDDVEPTVTITSAAETSGVAAQTITGSVVSGGAAAVVGQSVTLMDNGAKLAVATVQADGTFSAALTLPYQGTNTIVASVTDSFGNSGSATVVDTLASGSPPTFTWTGTANASMQGSSYGANIFVFGSGAESATGGTTSNGGNGDNTYQVSSSTGQATINANASAGSINTLEFTGGITSENL